MTSPAFDIGSLKPDGSHYVVIHTFIPTGLDLPDGCYKVLVPWNGRKIQSQVTLKKCFMSKPASVIANGIPNSEASYSSCHIHIPTRISSLGNEITLNTAWSLVHDRVEDYREIAMQIVNRIISIYRFFISDSSIGPIYRRNDFEFMLLFNELPTDAEESRFRCMYQEILTNESVLRIENQIPEEIIRDISTNLASGTNIPLVEELVLNAYSLLEEGNFRLAVIEAETGFETSIHTFLNDYYHDQPSVLEIIGKITSFTNLLKSRYCTSALSSLSKSFTTDDLLYEKWKLVVWKIRGDLVHGRITEVSRADAIMAIKNVEDVLEYLFDRQKIQLRKYAKYCI